MNRQQSATSPQLRDIYQKWTQHDMIKHQSNSSTRGTHGYIGNFARRVNSQETHTSMQVIHVSNKQMKGICISSISQSHQQASQITGSVIHFKNNKTHRFAASKYTLGPNQAARKSRQNPKTRIVQLPKA